MVGTQAEEERRHRERMMQRTAQQGGGSSYLGSSGTLPATPKSASSSASRLRYTEVEKKTKKWLDLKIREVRGD